MEPIKVAIADANTLAREGLKRILSAESDLIVIGEAANNVEAADIVERIKPDVLLLDLELPERNAVPLLLELKQKTVPTKVLILSRLPDQESILDTAKAGARGYVFKSIVPSALVRAIRKIHTGEIWVDRQLICADTFVEFARQAWVDDAGRSETEITKILSKRELEVLALVANGLTNHEISKRLFISVTTVKIHLNHVFGKLNVNNRIQAALLILQQCGELVKQVGLKYKKHGERGSTSKSKSVKSELSPESEAADSARPSRQSLDPRRRFRFA